MDGLMTCQPEVIASMYYDVGQIDVTCYQCNFTKDSSGGPLPEVIAWLQDVKAEHDAEPPRTRRQEEVQAQARVRAEFQRLNALARTPAGQAALRKLADES
jgi:hypothetical protein